MQKYGVVNTDLLNLRAGPSTTAQVLATLPTGTVLEIVADPGFDWLQVTVDGVGTQGYVSKSYLTLTDTKPGTSAAPATPAASASPAASTTPAQPSTPSVPATPPAPATPASTSTSAPIVGKGEVTTDSLNVRSGPGTTFPVLTTFAKGSVLNVLDKGGDWIKVRVGTAEGYVSAQYLDLNTTKSTTGYLIEQADLLVAKLPPDTLIPDQTPSTQQAVLARTWNQYGGFLGRLATLLGCPVNGIVATLTAESGGNCFGPDGRPIIRFEVHIFWNYWGKAHADIFNQYFQFDQSSPANGWKGHMFRPDVNSPWVGFHGKQASEYQVLTIARALDDTAALQSISMGAPQIMGFNYRRLGYDSVQSMYYQFSRSANAQLLAMFDFVRGTSSGSPAIDALKSRDYLTFAKIYNGPANAATYQSIISNYVTIFDSLVHV